MDSAEYFGFTMENAEEKIREYLTSLVKDSASPKRVKLSMTPQCQLSGEVSDFQPDDKVFKVCLAEKPVNPADVFLFHKTTHREVYDKLKIAGFDDTLLYNEKGELTEFTIGNLVVKMGGRCFTPPIECGLLPGTFRAELIASGEVKERVITPKDLAESEAVFLINSLRKRVRVLI
jgi:para-aminobenzoate synthetase/4-amino-4-deoxychorismate lyase